MEPSAWLIVRSGPDLGQQVAVTGQETTLGRSSHCDVVLTDGRASRQHARIRRQEGEGVPLKGDGIPFQGEWTIEDLGSMNGTFVNGQRLEPHTPCRFVAGDRLQVADTLLTLEMAQAAPDVRGLPRTRPRRSAHPLLLGAVAVAAFLLVVAGALAAVWMTARPQQELSAPPSPAPTPQAQQTPTSNQILELLQSFEGRLFAAGEMLVQFEPGVSEGEMQAFLAEQGLSSRDAIPALGLWQVEVDGGQAAPLLVSLRGNRLLSFAEPNAFAQLWAEPNDPYWPRQWNMRAIKAPAGWDLATGNSGEPVIIAIIDSGIDLTHPDLRDKIVAGYDFIEKDTTPQDENGHGTHVAGIAAATGNNGEGVAGVSWGAQIMPVRVVNAEGKCTVFDVAAGMVWATDHGARVLNLSLGFPLIGVLMSQGLMGADALRAAVDYAYQHDVLIVVATGNEYQKLDLPGYPAAYPHVVAVGAVDTRNEHAYYSNAGNYVDVVAPGGELGSLHDTSGVFSTMPDYQVALTKEGVATGYDTLQGTSMAAPHVAGLAALIWAANPALSNEQVAAIIEGTAQDLGPRGRDGCFGAGLIDVQRAVKAALSGQVPAGAPYEHGLAMSALCEAFTLWPETTFAVPIPTLDWNWEDWSRQWGP
jgi:subtilisin family serine protease